MAIDSVPTSPVRISAGFLFLKNFRLIVCDMGMLRNCYSALCEERYIVPGASRKETSLSRILVVGFDILKEPRVAPLEYLGFEPLFP